MKNEIVIIDERMRKIEKEKLKELGYKLKKIKIMYIQKYQHMWIFLRAKSEKN